VSAAISAVLLAALYMTHHIFIFLVIPMAVYFWVTGESGKIHMAIFLVVCAVAIAPWAVRNCQITGNPLLGGTGWDLMSHTDVYPGDTLYRTLGDGEIGMKDVALFPLKHFGPFVKKLMLGISDISRALVLCLGWLVLPFAVVGMLYRFKIASANAVRGLIYGILPLMVVCFAAYSVDSSAVVIFAPIGSILASAYFLLLLDAKKLHRFYMRCLIGLFVASTAYPAFASVICRDVPPIPTSIAVANSVLMTPMIQANTSTPVYTDVPWMHAWCTTGTAVWLPRTDQDVDLLKGKLIPMNMILLTPESENLPKDEVWPLLHRVKIWRTFISSPSEALSQLLTQAHISKEEMRAELAKALRRQVRTIGRATGLLNNEFVKTTDPDEFLTRVFRRGRYPVSDRIQGFSAMPQNLLQPDDVQILVRRRGGE
jgi:hypothetical protein